MTGGTESRIITVVAIEDQKEIREGLALLIDATDGFKCVGRYRSMEEALAGIGMPWHRLAGPEDEPTNHEVVAPRDDFCLHGVVPPWCGLPNAGAHLLPEAGATQERTL